VAELSGTSPQPAESEKAVKAIIFDIGRVIVRVNLKRALTTLGGGANLSPERVWTAIETDPRWREWQEGRIEPREWHEHLARRLQSTHTFEQFCAAWNSALDPEPILGEDLFEQLARRYRLVLLSNTDPIHVAYLEANFRFPRYFAARIYSCAVGACKPDPAIYRRAIVEARAGPEQVLYIDDAREYVEAGLQAGMQVHLFESAEHLLDMFRRQGHLGG